MIHQPRKPSSPPYPNPSQAPLDRQDSFFDDEETDALLGGPAHKTSTELATDLESGSRRERPLRSLSARVVGFLRRKPRDGAISLDKDGEQPKHSLGSRRCCTRNRTCWSLLVALMLGISALVAFLTHFATRPHIDLEDPLAKGHRLGLYGEDVLDDPSRVTKGVKPLPLHSHNDYWRRVPLYEALHFGCVGVEADVWHFEGDEVLYVGHDTRSLAPQRTFAGLYLDPLLDILDRRNANQSSEDSWAGVFQEDPSQSLILLVDFKTDGPTLWPYVMDQLETLRSRGYLTFFDGEKVVERPITIVGSGAAPFDVLVSDHEYRDIFYDAPLAGLGGHLVKTMPRAEMLSMVSWAWANILDWRSTQGTLGAAGLTAQTFAAENSFYASVSYSRTFGLNWFGELSDVQLKVLREQIAKSHERGLKARYWSTPNWPKSWQRTIWEALAREGADIINVDNLEEASRVDWEGLRKKD